MDGPGEVKAFSFHHSPLVFYGRTESAGTGFPGSPEATKVKLYPIDASPGILQGIQGKGPRHII